MQKVERLETKLNYAKLSAIFIYAIKIKGAADKNCKRFITLGVINDYLICLLTNFRQIMKHNFFSPEHRNLFSKCVITIYFCIIRLITIKLSSA